MKKCLKRIAIIGIMGCMLLSIPTYAGIGNGSKELRQKEISDYDTRRGDYISTSTSRITNEGRGVIGISAATTAHESVDKIRIHLYLDRLDADERWTQVDDFDFIFLPEDVPNGDLSEATVSFNINNQPSGYYYRVRGTHGVWKNGVIETQSTRTDGVMITNTP